MGTVDHEHACGNRRAKRQPEGATRAVSRSNLSRHRMGQKHYPCQVDEYRCKKPERKRKKKEGSG